MDVISLSGGIASAASAIFAHEQGWDYEMVFADTLIEHPDLYRFIDELSQALGKPYHHLKDGRDPWQVFVKERYIGNSRKAKCSQKLKTAQVKKWMNENCSPQDTLILGMYPDEEDRIWRARKNWGKRTVWSYLINYRIFPRQASEMVARYVKHEPELYKLGFPHNNCGGMCVRAGQGQFATLLKTRPEFYQDQADKMDAAMAAIGPTAKPFLSYTKNGVTHYVTMNEFKRLVESGELEPKMYEMGGCGCFVDDAA